MAHCDAFLRTHLHDYVNPDVSKRDISSALAAFTDLRPHRSTFVHNDGRQEELVNIDGTIPVNYKRVTYNIPICIYLAKNHPAEPPMGFVKPTQAMSIKPGKHVDSSGRIYLPYLHEWTPHSSDLMGMISILTIVFGEESPVFSKAVSTPYPTTVPPTIPIPTVYPEPFKQSDGTDLERQIKASLQSSVEENVNRRVGEIWAQVDAEMTTLRKTHEDLEQGKQRLDEMLKKSDRETDKVKQASAVLLEKHAQINEAITQLENRDKVDIDSAIVPSTPLYKQLLNAFAEEQAVEDAIFLLAEGLKKHTIDLDVFLKEVRELSRRQFLLRATVQKCRQVAKLPPLTV
ncbi:DgyrCDS225 [Dimorphilus gyrociliatus]|uniref:DgyrCDS225 n=1 Tax=Dimorphilus gyrociliatus TaxID=2664684 RepID=A0A7I8V569_9ANNE|nr:DgyrCDS225 [Dimorphilus gyrociliatus]